MTPLPATGTCATSSGAHDNRPDEALAALPRGARALVDAARGAGWGWVVQWCETASTDPDTGNPARYVSVKAARGPVGDALAGIEVRATWHTWRRGSAHEGPRPTVALYSLIVRRPYRGWADFTLRDATALIVDTPVAAAVAS